MQARDRIRLVLAAAHALGASREEADAIAAEVTRTGSPTEQLQNADETHRKALALLGRARVAHPVDDAARTSLVEAVRERELEAALEARGLVLRGITAARAETVAQLISAHPHGPVEVRGRGAVGISRALQRAGVGEDRLSVQRGSTDLEVVFLGYGNAPAGPDVQSM